MQQILWLDRTPVQKNLGCAPKNMSLREFVEAKTYHEVRKKRAKARKDVVSARRKYRASLEAAALVRAKYYV